MIHFTKYAEEKNQELREVIFDKALKSDRVKKNFIKISKALETNNVC